MDDFTQEDIASQFIHVLRIDLIDGTSLIYDVPHQIAMEVKSSLRTAYEDDYIGHPFISFSSKQNRRVVIRVSAIKQIMFIEEFAAFVERPRYKDNFKCTLEEDGDLTIPHAIFKFKNCAEPLVVSWIDENYTTFTFDREDEECFVCPGDEFMEYIDEDGESVMLPIVNIDCMEIAEEFVWLGDVGNY